MILPEPVPNLAQNISYVNRMLTFFGCPYGFFMMSYGWDIARDDKPFPAQAAFVPIYAGAGRDGRKRRGNRHPPADSTTAGS